MYYLSLPIPQLKQKKKKSFLVVEGALIVFNTQEMR